MDQFYSTLLSKAVQLAMITGRERVQGIIFARTDTDDEESVLAVSDCFLPQAEGWERRESLEQSLYSSRREEWIPEINPATELLLPFRRGGAGSVHKNYLYLRSAENQLQKDHHLIRLLLQQSEAAIKNIELYQKLHSVNRHALKMLAIASEYKDEDTGEHLKRIRDGSYALAKACGLEEELSAQIADASILHDVGKLGIPDEILQKPGRLTADEFQVIKGHTIIGSKILARDQWFSLAQEIAENHHERWDGKGYPKGRVGDDIPVHARIVAVIDVFDALTHERPYKDAWPIEDAIKEIAAGTGTQFDPEIVAHFLELHEGGALPHNDPDN